MTYPERQMYSDFRQQFGGKCWACQWQPLPQLDSVAFNPSEIHHVVGGAGRKHDRRCLVVLCKVHHMLAHGETIKTNDGYKLPALTIGQVLWLKIVFDRDYYDLDYIRSLRHKHNEPIEPEPVIYNIYE